MLLFFFFQAEDGIRDVAVTGVQTCALPIYPDRGVDLDGQPAHRLQYREKAVRRRARTQGTAAGDRPLERQPGPGEDLDLARGRRGDPARLALRDAGGRAGEAPRLLQGHQGFARAGEEAAPGS